MFRELERKYVALEKGIIRNMLSIYKYIHYLLHLKKNSSTIQASFKIIKKESFIKPKKKNIQDSVKFIFLYDIITSMMKDYLDNSGRAKQKS